MQNSIISGLINLNKPAGMTSRRAVDIVARLLGKIKIGHAGTLDPLAQGVLVLGLGSSTRLIEYVQRMRKRYTGTFLLGRRSSTEDTDGELVELVDPPMPTRAEITRAAAALIGDIPQRPPAFSALKVKGRRAYESARAGKPLVLKPRTVQIYGIEVVAYCYPQLTLTIECGSGTYIRSLGRDLAESLGTAAVMSGLTRTAVGCFTLDDAVELDSLSKQSLPRHILPPTAAVQMLPHIRLTDADLTDIRHGRTIPMKRADENPQTLSGLAADSLRAGEREFAGITADGRLVSILVARGGEHLGPLRNFFDY